MAKGTFIFIFHFWRVNPSYVELFRGLQYLSGAELYAESASFAPVLYYVYFGLRNFYFIRV